MRNNTEARVWESLQPGAMIELWFNSAFVLSDKVIDE